MSLANVSIVGNLVKTPEQMYFASGRVKTTMVVAVNSRRGGKDADNTSFYRIETWGKLAELAGKYLSKGHQVGVSGRLVLDQWTDKEGRNRITPIVEATQLAFPPKLKIVSNDERAAESDSGVTPAGGALMLSDEEGDEFTELSDATCGNTFEQELSVKEPAAAYRKSAAKSKAKNFF